MRNFLLIWIIVFCGILPLSLFSQTETANKKNIKRDNDTCIKANYPLQGTMTLLTYSSPTDGIFYGYKSGNNISEDKIKANLFSFDPLNPYISGAYIKFGFAYNTTNPEIAIALWSLGTIKPSMLLASKTIPLSEIIKDIENDRETFVQFDSSIKVTKGYFMGVILPTNAGDTVALMSNTNGDTNPGVAWEQWSDNIWHAYSEPNCWGINISNAIYPLACNKKIYTEVNNNSAELQDIKIFPNPAKDYINVQLNGQQNKNIKLKVYDLLGNCLKSFAYNSNYSRQCTIDIKGFPQGLYYLSVETENNKTTRKITIIK